MESKSPDIRITISRKGKGLLGKLFPAGIVGILDFENIPDELKETARKFSEYCADADRYRNFRYCSTSMMKSATEAGKELLEGLRKYRLITDEERIDLRTTFIQNNKPKVYAMRAYQ